MGRREVIRKLGELMTLRMAVNTRGGGLEETPDVGGTTLAVHSQ